MTRHEDQAAYIQEFYLPEGSDIPLDGIYPRTGFAYYIPHTCGPAAPAANYPRTIRPRAAGGAAAAAATAAASPAPRSNTMTTLNKALQLTNRNATVKIHCIIVSIELFKSKDNILVNVVLLDKDGTRFEAKSWSAKKAYYVRFNFFEDDFVILTCQPAGMFVKPNARFSGASYTTKRSSWMLERTTTSFRPKTFFPVHYDISHFHQTSNESQTAKSMVGTLESVGRGPLKYGEDRRVMAIGHYCKLRDYKNNLFQALLWESANRKFPFPLDNSHRGQLVLMPYARPQPEKYRSDIYTITSVYPPVLESQAINTEKVDELFGNQCKHPKKAYNPY